MMVKLRIHGSATYLVAAAIVTVLSTIALVALITGLSTSSTIAVLILLTSIGSIVLYSQRSTLSGFEVVVPAAAVIAVLYGIRPLVDLAASTQRWVGTDVSRYYNLALIASALFICSFYLTYLLLRPANLVIREVSMSRREAIALRRLSYLLFAGGAVGLIWTIQLSGGWQSYVTYRTTGADAGIESVAAVQYLMSLGIVASVIRFAMAIIGSDHRRGDVLAGTIFAAPVAIATLAEGSRRYVLPLIIAVAIIALIKTGRRLPVGTTLIFASLAILLVLLPQEAIRPGGSNQGASYSEQVSETIADPAKALTELFSSQSTSMLAAFALGIGDLESTNQPRGWGKYTLAETVLQPIPQQLWNSKPESIRNELIAVRFGLGDRGCLSLCPTYGPVASFYADFGLVGAAVGGAFVAAIAALWTRLTVGRADVFGVIAFAGTYWGFAYMWWSSISALTINILFFGVPLLLARFSGSSRMRV